MARDATSEAAAPLVALWAALVPAAAHAAPNLRAQADEIMKKDYNAFVAFKRNAHPAPFNWSDDGCSGPFVIRPVYRSLFNRPCQQHDFGYRNYGGGLRLGRNENARAWIDGRFLSEMRRLCTSKWGVLTRTATRGSRRRGLRCRSRA